MSKYMHLSTASDPAHDGAYTIDVRIEYNWNYLFITNRPRFELFRACLVNDVTKVEYRKINKDSNSVGLNQLTFQYQLQWTFFRFHML